MNLKRNSFIHTQTNHISGRDTSMMYSVWTDTEESFKEFVDHINRCHSSIKFTVESSTAEVNFPDTTVKLQNRQLTTDLYTKPTDTHNYLRYDLAHTPSCKKGIPYGQFLRIKKNCQTTEKFQQRLETMIEHFKNTDTQEI